MIESFTKDVEFEELKRLIHSLIERIDIMHIKQEKSGYFSLIIKYKNYDEYSSFYTNWQALKWSWVSHYRGAAYNQEDLDEDYEVELYLAQKHGRKPIPKKDFVGYTTATPMYEDIILKPEEVLHFD